MTGSHDLTSVYLYFKGELTHGAKYYRSSIECIVYDITETTSLDKPIDKDKQPHIVLTLVLARGSRVGTILVVTRGDAVILVFRMPCTAGGARSRARSVAGTCARPPSPIGRTRF